MSPNLKGLKGGLNRIQPGLGIGFIAAVLRREGYQVFIRDTALEGWNNQRLLSDENTVLIGETDEQIVKYLQEIRPDVVGISITFSNLADSARNLARIVKSVNPDTYVVIGGNHVTNAIKDYCYAQVNGLEKTLLGTLFVRDIFDENIDYALFGEGDYEFPKLLDCLINSKDIKQVSNLAYRNIESEIIFNSYPLTRETKRVDLNDLPSPAWDLFNMNKYFEIGAFHSPRTNAKKILPIMATRGCPEQCAFCTTPDTWGQAVRWRKPEDIRKEIDEAIKHFGGIDEIQFVDDNLTANIKRLYELCGILGNIGVPWCTPNGIKANYHINKQSDYFKRMQEAGCYQVTIACETGNQRVMVNIIGKNLKLHEAAKAVENAKNAGLFVHTFWIVGFPGETRDEMEKSMAFAASIGADSYSVSILLPLPGTKIYRKAIEENLFWPEIKDLENMTLRTSLLKADGFKSPHEFKQWVDRQNYHLNELLSKREPQRFLEYERSRDPKFMGMNMKQT